MAERGSGDAEAFEVPDRTTPRQRWSVTHRHAGSSWPQISVLVHGPNGEEWTYQRNYHLLGTFEPFRQLRGGTWHEYALISPNYTRTSVLDLATGHVIAEEQANATGAAFCPRQFYVPDWWDPDDDGENDGSLVPGCDMWEDHMGANRGNIGFVAGCVWGDDHSDKLQVLDLRAVADGVITRSAPFGYAELHRGVVLSDAEQVNWESRRVDVALTASFDLDGGRLCPWSLGGLNRSD